MFQFIIPFKLKGFSTIQFIHLNYQYYQNLQNLIIQIQFLNYLLNDFLKILLNPLKIEILIIIIFFKFIFFL